MTTPESSLRDRAARFVERPTVRWFITTLIVLNAISLGLETAPDLIAGYGTFLHMFDGAVLVVFVAEIGTKLFAYRLRFFTSGWNVFDLIVVGIALTPSSGPLAVLRAMRILRTLRLLSVVPQMRKVIGALLTAIPGIGSVGAIIVLFFYVGAVLTTKLYGTAFPEWFGTIGQSMYSLFQIMTLESWSMGIVRPVMERFPAAWLFFVPFILVTSFAILNLFIGIIVDAMQTQHAADEAENRPEDPVLAEVRALRVEIAELKSAMESRPSTSE